MNSRCVIVECTREIANLLCAGKALGCSVIAQEECFDVNAHRVKLQSAAFPEVPHGKPFPFATVEGQSDGTLRVIL